MTTIITNLFHFLTAPSRYIDRSNLWSLCTALFTLLLVVVAYFQLKKINKTTSADFIDRFKQDFFDEPTQKIMMLLEYSALKFMVGNVEYGKDIPSEELPYFEIDKTITRQLKKEIISTDITVYSEYEISDNLLGHFEDIGTLEKRGILDISLIYDLFSYYIEETWENEEIDKYIKWMRAGDNGSWDVYNNFEYIYKKCKFYGEAKRNKQWIWFWKIKWFVCQKF